MAGMELVSLLLFVFVVGVSVGQQPRESVKFDFAWRFYLGDLNPILSCNDSAFPRDLSKVQCLGLTFNQATSSDSCRDACCAEVMCAIWQFAKDQGCWMGQSNDCNHPNNDWVGGGRTVPATPPPPSKTGPTSRGYDDSLWEIIDVPHDGIINGTYDQGSSRGQGYLPKSATWYRKHFKIPKEWMGKNIWVYFEGVFRASTTYLNGQQLLYHDSGYSSFYVRLDNATNVYYGDGKDNENVLVVRADSNGGSGWWYEGGGIYRHNYLVATSQVHLMPDSVYGASNVTGDIHPHNKDDLSQGMYADTVMFYPQADVINEQTSGSDVKLQVKFTIYNENGFNIGSVDSSVVSISPGKSVTVKAMLRSTKVELWSNLRPYLYIIQTDVISDSKVLDMVNKSIGARRTHWDPNTGFYLNDVHFIWRGFNNHNDFTGVGMAVPDRVNLFRAQSMRAVGANSWRMSHNPPIPVMLDILDYLGVIVWDENREFGDNSIWVENQKNMVKRDRNHPSIMVWSFCNEAGCNLASNNEDIVGQEFRNVSYDEDVFRPVTANMNGKIGDGLTQVIDIQGFSHRGGGDFDSFHKQYPNKPLIGSECCSCTTQRGEDVGDQSKKILGNFNANCNKDQTEAQLDREFVAGCMVWTLFDYYGEPSPYGWPMVSSSFGSIDLSGFAKASAYWYRAWWLYSAKKNQTTGGNDVTINAPSLVNPAASPSEDNTHDGYLVHIVQHWESQSGGDTRTIQAYTNAPMAELFVNGKSMGVKKLDWQGWAEWSSVTYSPGNLTANALSAQNDVLATHTIESTGAPAKIVAHVDVPNESTGTGSALVLDGQDAGMVHAAIVDSKGHVVNSASNIVTFRVVSGPGRIIGVGNGNPSCHEPNKADSRSAYHGLARVIIQVTEDHSSSPEHRYRMVQIDSHGGLRTKIIPPGKKHPVEDIIVEATVEGLGSSQVSIPVSVNSMRDGVLSVAKNWKMK